MAAEASEREGKPHEAQGPGVGRLVAVGVGAVALGTGVIGTAVGDEVMVTLAGDGRITAGGGQAPELTAGDVTVAR